jgi:hypothetical protein
LCEAAKTAKRHPQFAASYLAIARRRGKKIATTAISPASCFPAPITCSPTPAAAR